MSVVVAPEVAQFVTAVRAELADLDPEVVEELTGGLEADLTDSLEAVPGNEFGDPVAYAAELRSAAGLPPRPPAPPGLAGLGPAALAGVLLQGAATLAERVTGHPRWPAVRDFVVTLRPVWWVARAWVAYVFLADAAFQGGRDQHPFPIDLGPQLVLVAMVAASVQLGRRSAAGTVGRWRMLVLLANVPLALTFPFMAADAARMAMTSQFLYPAVAEPGASPPADGLYLNGNPVTNVRPYDAQGRPLTGVQLFDQDGNRLEVRPNSSNNTAVAPDGLTESLPRLDANGEARWNVFPLEQRPTDPMNPPQPVPTAVDPLPDAAATPSVPAAASPSTSPSAPGPGTPTASATPSTTATASGTPSAPASSSP